MSQAFSGQRSGERVLFVFRRHILTARKGLLGLLIFLTIGFIPLLIWPTHPRMFLAPIIGAAVGLLVLAYHYVIWHFSIYIVTTERIRQISQKNFFKKTVIDLPLGKIQSISFSVPGFFGSVFGYGTIVIQTAVGDLIISQAAHPEKIYNKLQNSVDLASRKQQSNG